MNLTLYKSRQLAKHIGLFSDNVDDTTTKALLVLLKRLSESPKPLSTSIYLENSSWNQHREADLRFLANKVASLG